MTSFHAASDSAPRSTSTEIVFADNSLGHGSEQTPMALVFEQRCATQSKSRLTS